MASYDLKAILGEKLKRLTGKTLKALVDCMCTVGASLCSLDKRVSALESVELPEGGYKPMQEPVASPSASGTAIQFIDSMSQDATGRTTSTKKTVRSASGSQSGVMSSAHYTKLDALYSKDELDDLFGGKANKGEMSITPGTGTDADKTTIQLKTGTSATVLTQHQDVSGKFDKTAVTSLTDWNTLADTGLYIVNTSNTVANEPERGEVACYVTNIDGYISQLAVGNRVYMRFKRALEQSWQHWVVLQDSSGTTASELYSSTQGGYFSIARAALETANSTGTTSIAGGTTAISDNNSAHTTTITPEHVVVGAQGGSTIIEPGVVTVNGLELNTKADVTAAIPASSNEKLKNITHLLVNGNKTLKLSEMIENKAYVFHVVSSGAVVSVYNDDTSAFTIKHRGTDVSVAESSSSSLNSSTDPAGEIWLARVGRNIYMSKSCEDGKVPSAYAADSATNADITKTSSATNGDTLQIGNGNAVTIGNAAKSNKSKYSDSGKELDKASWVYRYYTPSPVMIQNGDTVGWMECPTGTNEYLFVLGHRNSSSDNGGGICPASLNRLIEIDFNVDVIYQYTSNDHWQTFLFRAKTITDTSRTESFSTSDSSFFAETRVSTWVKASMGSEAYTTLHVRLVGYLGNVGTAKSIIVGCKSLFAVAPNNHYLLKGYNFNVKCSTIEDQKTY